MSHDDDHPGGELSHSMPTVSLCAREDEADEEPFEVDLTGRILDERYRLLHRLGAGGMGVVYAAEHIKLGTRMAIKVLKPEYALAHQTHRKRFLREAKSAAMLRDPNIIQITDFGETPDDIVYFAMELLDGCDLAGLLAREGRLPWPRARGIVLQVASALELAHQHRIIHRDVKPSNCMIFDDPRAGRTDRVKVLDFGIAKLEGGNATSALTGTTELFGTVAYMAPELVEGVPASAASDIYALGVMLFQMLTGELPFRGPTPIKVLTLHMSAPPPRPSAIEPTVPPDVEAIVLRCLAKEPKERFERMADVAAALRHAGQEASTTREPHPPRVLPSAHGSEPLHRRRRGAWVPAVVGVGVIVAMGVGASLWLDSTGQDLDDDRAPAATTTVPRSARVDLGSSAVLADAVEPESSGLALGTGTPSIEEEASIGSTGEAADGVESTLPDRAQRPAPSSRRRAPTSSSRSVVARLKKKLRKSCGSLASRGTTLTIKMPMGSDGKPLLVVVMGGTKDLEACVREILRKEDLTGSGHDVIGFELEL